jgi:hypothetical protein
MLLRPNGEKTEIQNIAKKREKSKLIAGIY